MSLKTKNCTYYTLEKQQRPPILHTGKLNSSFAVRAADRQTQAQNDSTPAVFVSLKQILLVRERSALADPYCQST